MPQWTTLQDTAITLSPNDLAADEGWTVSNGVAYHDSCFAGIIILKNIEVEAGKSYILEYLVKAYTLGEVHAIVGGASGTPRTETGQYKEQFDVPDDATDLTIQFYSDGTLGVSYMDIYPVLEDPDNGHILAFNIDNDKWPTYYSVQRENMLKFINDFFCFKDGRLYKMNSNETRNFFFGTQYTSKLTLVVNAQPTEIKNFFSMRIKSNKRWGVLSVTIPPSEGKEDGMRSRIKQDNFKLLNNGDYFADFLRNMDDPRFNTELDALFNGALLQGSYAVIELECDATDELKLLSIDFEIGSQQYTY